MLEAAGPVQGCFQAGQNKISNFLFLALSRKACRLQTSNYICIQVQGDEFPTVETFMAKYRLDAPAALERIKVTQQKQQQLEKL